MNRNGDKESSVGLADIAISWEGVSHLDGGEFSVVGRVSRIFEVEDLASYFNSETSELPSIVGVKSVFKKVDFKLHFNVHFVVNSEGSNGDESIFSLEVVDDGSAWIFGADGSALVDFLLNDGEDSESVGFSKDVSEFSIDVGNIGVIDASPSSFSDGVV